MKTQVVMMSFDDVCILIAANATSDRHVKSMLNKLLSGELIGDNAYHNLCEVFGV